MIIIPVQKAISAISSHSALSELFVPIKNSFGVVSSAEASRIITSVDGMEILRSILERYLKEVQQSDSSQSSISPFYGIWCGAAKTEAEAQKQAKKIRENGFDAQVFVTTDWSNLNTEKWYVITAGTYGTEEAASAVLPDVQRVCSNAYIKYSGNWQG